MPRPFLILAALLLLAAATALAQPQHPERLAGSLFLGGATLVDPPPEEATGTHAYITITGAAARRMCVAMPGRAVADACEPGRQLKHSGAVRCSAGRAANDAARSFGLELARGRLAGGTPC